MDLLDVGTWGYQTGAVGILVFTSIFLMSTKWWTDLLGRMLASVFGITSLVLVLSSYRSLTHTTADGFLWVRVFVYWAFGLGVWLGIASFVWAQFFAPRIKHHRTTRRENRDVDQQKGSVADPRRDRDGDSDDRSGVYR